MKMINKIINKIKKINAYCVFIEKERIKAAEYTCSSGPLL